jgi:HSP20 family protein
MASAVPRSFATKSQELSDKAKQQQQQQPQPSRGGEQTTAMQQHQQQYPQQSEHTSFFDEFSRLHDTVNALLGDFGQRRGGGGRRNRRGGRGRGMDPLGIFEDELLADWPHNELLAPGRQQPNPSLLPTHAEHPAGQLSNMFGLPLPTLRCRVNVEDQKDKLVVTSEVPGFDKSNLKVDIDADDVLTISGEQKQEHVNEAKDKKFLRVERSFGQVQRSLKLPRHVDRSKIAARYENGILHIDLPKGEEQAKQTSINIQ